MKTRRLLADLWKEEDAGVLALVGLALVLVLGLAAFATDLGWFYVNANRIQRAADAAALSGVIHMPQEPGLATSDAHASARTNGYIDGTDFATVVPVPAPGGEIHQLQVTITDTVDTFFLRVFGSTDQTIARRATAEYIPPLPMGSPGSEFGNSCDPAEPGCSGQPEFWANIHGRYTDTRMGDAHSSWCNDGGPSGGGCGGPQPGWRSRGYLYGIETDPSNTSFTVQLLDMNLHVLPGSGLAAGAPYNADPQGDDHYRTGDHNECSNCTFPDGHEVIVTVYQPDPTPLLPTDAVPVPGCTKTYPAMPVLDPGTPYVFDVHCTVSPSATGLYTMEVRINEDSGTSLDDSGLNRYAARVTGSGSTPRLYGIGDMSIFNNLTGGSPTFHLAEVADFYRGKTFVVEMYDPGDAQSGVTNIINILGPGAGSAWPSCKFFTRDEPNQSWTFQGNRTPCAIDATRPANNYNGIWLKMEMDLPDVYACAGSDCWWKVRYDYAGTAQDTTTWRAYIVGNPVHLIPNG